MVAKHDCDEQIFEWISSNWFNLSDTDITAFFSVRINLNQNY